MNENKLHAYIEDTQFESYILQVFKNIHRTPLCITVHQPIV